ncbi:MAG: carbamoyltransferase HypF [Dongiaceae bacterium]
MYRSKSASSESSREMVTRSTGGLLVAAARRHRSTRPPGGLSPPRAAFHRIRRGRQLLEDDLNQLLSGHGFIARLARPLFRMVGRSWHMYPLGFVLGLGFDTATEVGLLAISGTQGAQGMPIWSVMVFPALFTAGMALVDTADSALMVGAYGWAFVKPIRKLWCNMTITAASVAVALLIGGLEGRVAPSRRPQHVSRNLVLWAHAEAGFRRVTRSVNAIVEEVRVRGTVQGVGFRPAVWRLARQEGLAGHVANDGAGVLIRLEGPEAAIARFLDRLGSEPPPLARIARIERARLDQPAACAGFSILESRGGTMRTAVPPDAALCPACRSEILSPADRRFRHPFASCTHCGPRFSIVRAAPWDRARTSMAGFAPCPDCAREYGDPADRRFHAQPIACPRCGPRARLIRLDGRPAAESCALPDAVEAVGHLLARGEIVAIKGIGGFHLACDATDAEAVRRLRVRKHRDAKPFALMARDLEVVRQYAVPDVEECRLLESAAAPIVLLRATGPERLPEDVAPGLDLLGFMLPYTPLHVLALRRLARPVVMTSGNLSDEPQAIDDEDAIARLGGIADHALLHDRAIVNRIDDSVVRMAAGAPRILRRARGYAPGAIALPPGFEAAPPVLAHGGELKATFCLAKDGQAVLSQHQGDLENAATLADYEKNLALYADLFEHRPAVLAADRHPDYLSARLARRRARAEGLPLVEVQHHHAHIAACLAENGRPLDAPPVLGIALDGLGFGEDGTLWGGEFLLADYRRYRRVGSFRPVAMPGGAQAIREPWRSTYTHLMAGPGWAGFEARCGGLELYDFLAARPRATLDAMIRRGVNAPLASSCGRLFDAVAAALGLARERARYEGQGAMLLEAAVDRAALEGEDEALAYPFAIAQPDGSGPATIEPAAMWQALLGDLVLETPVGVIAARFHRGLARAVAAMAARLLGGEQGAAIDAVALSGGCVQNRILLEQTVARLAPLGRRILLHAAVPANDGGLALGQAAIAAALTLEKDVPRCA